MISRRTIVIQFHSKRKKDKFFQHIHDKPSFRPYIDGHAEKIIFLKFDTIDYRTQMMDMLKSEVPRYKIIHNNNQEQIKIL